jgi:hypothetical protein
MFRYALPFPSAPGKTEDDIKSISASFTANPSGHTESRKRRGITLAASTRPFDLWFKSRLKELFPPQVDFDKPLPVIVRIFDSIAVMARA